MRNWAKVLRIEKKIKICRFTSKIIQRGVNTELSVERRQKYVHKI